MKEHSIAKNIIQSDLIKILSMLFAVSPILLPLFRDEEPMSKVLITTTFIGLIFSFVWLKATNNTMTKVLILFVALWYLLFSFLIIYKLYQ